MKKLSLFALLVLAGMLFAAPALRAQETQETEAQKKAKAVKAIEDDDQLLNFLRAMDPETLAGYVSAVIESGDASLIDRMTNALNNMGTDIATALSNGSQQPAAPAGDNGGAEGADQGEGAGDKAAAAISAIAAGFADAGATISGSDFNTSNPVANSASLSRPVAE